MEEAKVHLKKTVAAIAVAGIALIAGCSATGGPGEGSSDDAVTTIRLATVPVTTVMQLYIAEQQGFFEDNGLDVEIIESPNLGTFAPALGSQYDVIYGTQADIILAAESGFPLSVISGSYVESESNQQVQLIAGAGSGITSIQDLAGKRIAAPTLAGTLYAALTGELEEQGVGRDGATIVEVPFPNMADQLNGGQVDAVLAIEPFIGGLLAQGHKPLSDPFLSVADPTLIGMWAADRQWATNHPDAVAAFRDSLQSAIDWIDENDAPTRESMQEVLGVPAAVAESVALPDWTVEVSPDDIEPWVQLLVSSGQITGAGPDLDALVYQG